MRAARQLTRLTDLLNRTQEISKTGGWEYDVATGELSWTDEVYRIYGLDRTDGPPDVAEAVAAFDAESKPVLEAAFQRLVAEGEALRPRAGPGPPGRSADLGAHDRPARD